MKKQSKRRALRGSAWYSLPISLHSANRGRDAATERDDSLGFRLVQEEKQNEKSK